MITFGRSLNMSPISIVALLSSTTFTADDEIHRQLADELPPNMKSVGHEKYDADAPALSVSESKATRIKVPSLENVADESTGAGGWAVAAITVMFFPDAKLTVYSLADGPVKLARSVIVPTLAVLVLPIEKL